MSDKLASKIRKGDVLVFHASNGRTLANVTGVEMGSEADLVDPGFYKDPKPMVRLHVNLARAVIIQDLNWRTVYWTMWHYPEERVEVYDRGELRRGAR